MKKTFKDLVFKPHPVFKGSVMKHLPVSGEQKQATIEDFGNGYGVSVLCGEMFCSNGRDTYELAILKNGILCYGTEITDDVLRDLTEDEVTEVMKKVQELEE